MPDRSSPSPSRTGSQRPMRRLMRWTTPMLIALIVGAVGGVAVAAAIHVPRVEALAGYTPSLVTQLYARDGSVFATFARERRVMLKPEEIPDTLENAVLASEDSNFYRHGGVDALGIARAALADLRAGKVVEGASTITMQLARSLFLSRQRTWSRKIEEAFVAVELEKNYSKQQILTLYLNLVNLGHGNYGVEAASRYYFGKPTAKLSLPEVATIVGIIPAPSRYSPYRNSEQVLRNRNRVLRRMFEERFIDQKEYEQAVAQPLLVTTQQAEERFAPYFAEDIRKYLEAKYGPTALYEGGLQVRTTLDPQIQRAAEKAVRSWLLRIDHRRGWRGPIITLEAEDLESQQLPTWDAGEPVPGRWYQGVVLESGPATATVKIGDKRYTLDAQGIAWTRRRHPDDLLKRGAVAWFRLEAPEEKKAKKGKEEDAEPAAPPEPKLMLEQEPRMEAAAVVIENESGAVRAMVGGWDFARNKFNRVTQARRQVGSAFKPFVYGAALEAGWTPSDTLLDAPTYFLGADGRMSYRPENYYKKHAGIVTLRRALEQSINVPAVKLWDLVGGRRVIDFAYRCGISTRLPNYPSISLGAADLVPLELAGAYATIANLGMHVTPFLFERVASPDGHVLERRFPGSYLSTSPQTAYVLTHMMEGVIDHGTAYELKRLPINIAGKTGTTNDFTDAWFVGYTPRYTILTWIGYDAKKPLGYGMSGAMAALPMWKMIAEDGIEKGWIKKDEPFRVPAGVEVKDIEYYSGLLAKGGGKTIKEAFVAGTEPAREFSSQWQTINSLPWYQQKAFYIPKEGEKMPGQAAPGTPRGASGGQPGPQEAPAPPKEQVTEGAAEGQEETQEGTPPPR